MKKKRWRITTMRKGGGEQRTEKNKRNEEKLTEKHILYHEEVEKGEDRQD